jgi:hypothetical protein
MRSMQMRRAGRLPCLAFVITFLTSFSASPSRSCSASTVAAFRVPGGRPFGFPLRPFGKGRPRCFGAVDSVGIPLHICVAAINQVERAFGTQREGRRLCRRRRDGHVGVGRSSNIPFRPNTDGSIAVPSRRHTIARHTGMARPTPGILLVPSFAVNANKQRVSA